ncbi:MAG: winged helix-turn-helix transcriptional regulator [Crenarchaeota archaeon]|nr:MAG: winged helix-turn-helix transcriptional regulator [Thermoproteota archaeon]RDJ34279.1 MAG: winged helix-turn-helix transcriptional regulator [Thermoproteota archaeon]RDJ36608.1 MAG: winged helix-turn-helix transcriptional regulator [Thermoproteota archaeon]RDJ37863.1 MAG: winged helix-turn-helix transcriptional regulator [Thermoproteota archaeon]
MIEQINQIIKSLRECDRKIISFIYANGGQVYEKDIRNQLDEPRTTVWRTIKRLEEKGIIIVRKEGNQNLIVLIVNQND